MNDTCFMRAGQPLSTWRLEEVLLTALNH